MTHALLISCAIVSRSRVVRLHCCSMCKVFLSACAAGSIYISDTECGSVSVFAWQHSHEQAMHPTTSNSNQPLVYSYNIKVFKFRVCKKLYRRSLILHHSSITYFGHLKGKYMYILLILLKRHRLLQGRYTYVHTLCCWQELYVVPVMDDHHAMM